MNPPENVKERPSGVPNWEPFGKKLAEAMRHKGLSASDLARAVWGEKKDARGYPVARNRDRISHYLKGAQMPTPENLTKIANALEVELDELTPSPPLAAGGLLAPYAFPDPIKVQIKALHGSADVTLELSYTQDMPFADAVELLNLLNGFEQRLKSSALRSYRSAEARQQLKEMLKKDDDDSDGEDESEDDEDAVAAKLAKSA
jgi:transcriptional regulator with XRE-family HTH domain